MNKPSDLKVVITDCMHLPVRYEEEVLAEYGITPELHFCRTEEQVMDAARGADGLMVHFAPISKKVIDTLDNVKIISRYGVGLDNIDIPAATAAGILVCNVPTYCTNEVADQTLALLMAVNRKTIVADELTRKYDWEITNLAPVDSFEGKTVGLVGYGKIGSAFARRVKALECKVLVYDPFIPREEVEKEGYEYTDDLDQIWQNGDFISLHVPLNNKTKYIVGENELKKMKKSAIVINTSRGKLIEEAALYKALQEGEIRAAALDVFEKEPPPIGHPLFEGKEEEFVNPLYSLPPDKITVTPHMGWYSERSYRVLKQTVARQLAEYFQGNTPENAVNPEVLK